MADATTPETADERITRLRAEVASLRASRDSQLATGAEKRNGVFVVREASLQTILDELRRKERELDLAERGAAAFLGQFTTGGHHA